MEESNEYNNQTMQNEKDIICKNDEIEVDQVMEERENPNLQIEINIVSRECDEEKSKHILQELQIQRKKWRPHNRNAICWSFYSVNDNSKVNLYVPQMMHCLLCYFQPIISMNSRKRLRKRLISYYNTSDITCL
jgi:hypothetical protein